MNAPDDTAAARRALEAERVQIQREINGYPTPIPGCDVYFNDLLERRARVCEALSRLDQAEPPGGRC